MGFAVGLDESLALGDVVRLANWGTPRTVIPRARHWSAVGGGVGFAAYFGGMPLGSFE